jgi:hypothetical protein
MRAVVRLREHRKEEKIQIQKPENCCVYFFIFLMLAARAPDINTRGWNGLGK